MKTGEELFMRYGVKRVTVEEICRTARVSKMTFYKYFKNKHDMAKGVIVALYDEGQARFDRIMSKDKPFGEKMKQFVQFKLEYGRRTSKEFYRDMLSTSPEIHEFLEERSQRNVEKMMDLFRRARKDGEIREDLNLEFVSFMLDHVLELSEDPRLLSIFPNTYELVRDWLDFFFYGIMGQREPEDA